MCNFLKNDKYYETDGVIIMIFFNELFINMLLIVMCWKDKWRIEMVRVNGDFFYF